MQQIGTCFLAISSCIYVQYSINCQSPPPPSHHTSTHRSLSPRAHLLLGLGLLDEVGVGAAGRDELLDVLYVVLLLEELLELHDLVLGDLYWGWLVWVWVWFGLVLDGWLCGWVGG